MDPDQAGTETQNEQQVAQHDSIDNAMREAAMERFRSEQNLLLGIVAGASAALVGALIWSAITVATGYQIGWMAIGVGFLVGFAVRAAGKGLSVVYGVIGAVLALAGCLAGNMFSIVHWVAEANQDTYSAVLGYLDSTAMIDLMKESFSPIDLLFYGFAIFEGFKISIRTIGADELAKAIKGQGVVGAP